MKAFESISSPAYALMRVVTGLIFAFKGMQKIFGVMSDFQPAVGSQVWIGGWIELITGLLIALGFLTPWAALLASGTMAVAYVQFHWKFDFGAGFLPAVNKGEAALINAVVFLYIASRGGGFLSIDRLRSRW